MVAEDQEVRREEREPVGELTLKAVLTDYEEILI